MTTEMNAYHVTFTETDGPKETFDLLVYAVDQLSAEEWAVGHADRYGLTLSAEMARKVPDVAAWAKTHESREPASRHEDRKNAAAAKAAKP